MEGWEMEFVAIHQQYFPIDMNPHLYKGRGNCGAFPYITRKEN
jgi:hypothetical protein